MQGMQTVQASEVRNREQLPHLLHDAGDEEVLAIADGVHLALGTHDVLVQQDGVVHIDVLGDDAHVLDDVGLRVGHDHILTAEDVGRTHQNRQADLVGCGQSLFQIEDSAAGCAGDAAALR